MTGFLSHGNPLAVVVETSSVRWIIMMGEGITSISDLSGSCALYIRDETMGGLSEISAIRYLYNRDKV